MPSITQVDDDVLRTAWEILNQTTKDGTKNIYRTSKGSDEKGVIRYDSKLTMEEIKPGEEFPRSAVLWGYTKAEIKDEMERRGLDTTA